jgi:hypothetical protein
LKLVCWRSRKTNKKNKAFQVDGMASVKTNTALSEALKKTRARRAAGLAAPVASNASATVFQPSRGATDEAAAKPSSRRFSKARMEYAHQVRERSAKRLAEGRRMIAEQNGLPKATAAIGNMADDAIKYAKENPLEAADLAASFTEPYGTAWNVVDIAAGTTRGLYHEITGDQKKAMEGWIQAGTGGAAVFVPFASGVAVQRGMDVYNYRKAKLPNATRTEDSSDMGVIMNHPRASTVSPRKGSFDQSYPDGAVGRDGAKLPMGARLEIDVDGYPIHPNAIIAGHRRVGAPNVPVSPRDTEVIGGSLARNRLATPEDRDFDLDANFGEFRSKEHKNPKAGVTRNNKVDQKEILLNPKLSHRQHHRTYAHEVSYAIDDAIDQHALGKLTKDHRVKNELFQVYHEMVGENAQHLAGLRATPNKNGRVTPVKAGYSGHKKEIVAEGFRAYLANPEYFKRVAPNAARALRAQVRETPKLRKLFHLNSFNLADGDPFVQRRSKDRNGSPSGFEA